MQDGTTWKINAPLHCLEHVTPDGARIGAIGVCSETSGGSRLNPLQFGEITGVALDSKGNLFVTDAANNRVVRVSQSGMLLDFWGVVNSRPGSEPKEFNAPRAVVVDGCDRVWIADALNARVQIITANGRYLRTLSCFGADAVNAIAFEQSHVFVEAGANVFVLEEPTADCSETAFFNCEPLRNQ